jgi:membrane protein YdbS with pleckstrin-like domain
MSQSFIESKRVARIRPRAMRLFLPFTVLAAACFAVSFYFGRLPEPWMEIALYAVAGALAFAFWLIPLLRYLSAYVDIHTTRLVARSGLMGQHRSEASFNQITGVEIGRGRRILVHLIGGESIELPALPRSKKIVAELEKLIANL